MTDAQRAAMRFMFENPGACLRTGYRGKRRVAYFTGKSFAPPIRRTTVHALLTRGWLETATNKDGVAVAYTYKLSPSGIRAFLENDK